MKALWGEMTWPDLKAAAGQDRVVIIVAGSLEGHGPHLPVDTDARLAEAACRGAAAAAPDRVLVLPVVPYGICGHHMDFPGTISIGEATYIQFMLDICLSVIHHGFRRLLIVNGHGGNQPALDLVARMVVGRHPEVICAATAYYVLPEAVAAEERVRDHPMRGSMGHADFAETSLYLALHPSAVEMERAVDYPLPEDATFGFSPEDAPVTMMRWWSAITPSGVLGYPTRASAAAGGVMLEGAVRAVIAVADRLRAMESGTRVDHHLRSES
ncbi:MAG: creatininase family protein [bacterium]|nr:creatininase family protein [bacterium]